MTAEDAKTMLLQGGFIASHTRDGHTKNRVGSGGRMVKLDPFVINSHVQQVIYDLEMGDAITDAYKVLHHPEVKKAFRDVGKSGLWEALDVWLGDVTTGEIHRSGFVENMLRTLRTGTTISAIGFNVGVAMLQPLGLIQSSVQIGHRYMFGAAWEIVNSVRKSHDITAPYKLLQWVTDQSGFMRERERSFNKDIVEAQKGLRTGLMSRVLPGRTAEHIGDFAFLATAKMQRMVDFMTWLAAKRKGMELFNGDQAKSTKYADRMVARPQRS
jgi:hypothetical protein